MADAAIGLYGSVMSMIWTTPLSDRDATRAYVDESIFTVAIERGLSSAV